MPHKRKSTAGQGDCSIEVSGGQTGVACHTVNGGLHVHLTSGESGKSEDKATLPATASPAALVDCASETLPPHPHGDALEIDSRFYVERPEDLQILQEIRRPRGLVTLKGPNQSGKGSMLMRAWNGARQEEGLRAVYIDFAGFNRADFDTSELLWRRLTKCIALALNPETSWPVDGWQDHLGVNSNLNTFLDECVFAYDQNPIVLCLDEVDRVFGYPSQNDFCSQLRALWNRGAIDPPWGKVRWLFSTSTEPSFFIRDAFRSPFNIGMELSLGCFTAEQTVELAGRYGISLDDALLYRVMSYLGGRPYLLSLLFYHLKCSPLTAESFLDPAGGGERIFGKRLHKYLEKLQESPELKAAMRSVLAGRRCPQIGPAWRLKGAGLIVEDRNGGWRCSCELYRHYFQDKL